MHLLSEPEIPSLLFTQRNENICPCKHLYSVVLFSHAETRNNPNCQGLVNKLCGIHIQPLNNKMEWNTDTQNNTDEYK